MNPKILLPFQILAEKSGVTRIVAAIPDSSFGLLPQRLDCVAALEPGILIYETVADGEVFVAVHEGVLVKTGPDVRVSVRQAYSAERISTACARRWNRTINPIHPSFVAPASTPRGTYDRFGFDPIEKTTLPTHVVSMRHRTTRP